MRTVTRHYKLNARSLISYFKTLYWHHSSLFTLLKSEGWLWHGFTENLWFYLNRLLKLICFDPSTPDEITNFVSYDIIRPVIIIGRKNYTITIRLHTLSHVIKCWKSVDTKKNTCSSEFTHEKILQMQRNYKKK